MCAVAANLACLATTTTLTAVDPLPSPRLENQRGSANGAQLNVWRVIRVAPVGGWNRPKEEGMDATMIMALCGFALLSGTASWRMAIGKSRRIWLWTAVGVLANVPGMLLLVILPVHRPPEAAGALEVAEVPAARWLIPRI